MANIENKPIALVTGSPGSGKTALLVDFMAKAVEQGRPIFQQGISELKLNHYPLPPIEEWTEHRPDPDHPQMTLPYFTFPENSLVVLSEAQRIFRPRASGSKIPDHVAAFETCRHTGVTFVMDTQHPDFVDSHIRKLVGQHIHLIDFGLLGRKHYEWPYTGKPDEFKSAPIKKGYKLPKHVFDLYKSSSMHIKRNYTIPPALIVFALCLLIVLAGSWYLYGSIQKKVTPQKPVPEQSAKQDAQAPSFTPVQAVTADEMLVEFTPRVPSRPETAPAYDQLRQVKNMPVVVGCYATANRCRCVNQQGLEAGLDDMQCRQWLANPPFDAYRDQPQLVQAMQNEAGAQRPARSASPDSDAPPPQGRLRDASDLGTRIEDVGNERSRRPDAGPTGGATGPVVVRSGNRGAA